MSDDEPTARREGRPAPASTRGKRTRDRVLRAAVEVFGRQGFNQTSMLDIAKEAGVASGTVYQYFSDKSDIFAFLLTDLRERLHRETRMPAGPDGRLVVHDSVIRYLDIYREYAPIFRVWWELMEPPTEFTAEWIALHRKSRTEMTGVIRDGQARGLIDKGVDPEITADLIVAMFERPAYSRIVLGWDAETSDEDVADLMGRMLGSGLAG